MMEEIIVLFLTISIVTAVPIDNVQSMSDNANQIQTVNEEQQTPVIIENSGEPRGRISGNAMTSDRINTMTSDRLKAMTSDRVNTMTSDRLSNLQDPQSLPALNMLNEHSDQQGQQETASALNPSASQLSTSSEDLRHGSQTDQNNDQHNGKMEDLSTSQSSSGFRNTPRVSISEPYQNMAWNGQSINSDNFAQAQDGSLSEPRFRTARLSPMSSAFRSNSPAFHRDPYRNFALNDQPFISNDFVPLNNRFTPGSRVRGSGFTPDPLLLSDILAELQWRNELLNDQYPNHADVYYPPEFYDDPMLDSPSVYEDILQRLSPSNLRSSRNLHSGTHLTDGLDLRLHPYAASMQLRSHDSQHVPYLIGQDNNPNANNEFLQSERHIDRLGSISMHTPSNSRDRFIASRHNQMHFSRRGNSDSLDPSQNVTPRRQRNIQMRLGSQQYDPLRSTANRLQSARTLPTRYISRENTIRIPLNRRHEVGLNSRTANRYWDS